MQISTNEYYGFYGQVSDDYDEFLGFGKKAKKRRKERRARKKEKIDIRHERRRLKNDALRANTEAQRAQTTLTQSIVSPTPRPMPVQTSPISSAVTSTDPNPAQVQAQALRTGQSLLAQQQPLNVNANNTESPENEQPDLLSNPIVLGIGVLIVGGVIYHLYKTRQAATPALAIGRVN